MSDQSLKLFEMVRKTHELRDSMKAHRRLHAFAPNHILTPQAWPREDVLFHIREEAGKIFDPAVDNTNICLIN